MTYLIDNGALKQSKGNYKDYSGDKRLVVTGKYGNGRGKQRFAPTPLLNRLLELREKEKEVFDINNVKHNQRYLFSECVS